MILPFSLFCEIFRRLKHIFNKDSVPTGGIVDKHVRHGAYELAILNNRTAAQ